MKRKQIAIIGSGISGLSCAWLLARQHQVTLYEKDDRFGGHSNTVDVTEKTHQEPQALGVDTGFIVFNDRNYPNLVQLFDHLQVPTVDTDMSFSVSLNQGRLEYAGSNLNSLFAQRGNLVNPRFWSMIRDLLRFYREAEQLESSLDDQTTLGELLDSGGYREPFRNDHLLPMGAAIWSTPADKMMNYPARTFLRFCRNHGLVQLNDRPQWRTVSGGSRTYVEKLLADIGPGAHSNRAARQVRRRAGKVEVTDWHGETRHYDDVVLACHADQSLRLLVDPDPGEQELLSKFKFERNRTLLHSDPRLMPRRRNAWASWNYLGELDEQGAQKLCVTYWMNHLQHLSTDQPMLVTLNPVVEPAAGTVHASFLYDHPLFTPEALSAQSRLWSLQGRRQTWFCGAWFGYGFHEDGLQSGLAVAEQLGGVSRPWQLENPNSRITVTTPSNQAVAA